MVEDGASESDRFRPLKLLTFVGFAVAAAGVFFTWSDNSPFSETGLDRGSGVFVLVVAVAAAAIVVLDRRPRGAIIAISAAVLTLIATVVDLIDIASGSGSPGAGLYLSLVGAAGATTFAALLAFSLFKKPAPSR